MLVKSFAWRAVNGYQTSGPSGGAELKEHRRIPRPGSRKKYIAENLPNRDSNPPPQLKNRMK